MKNSLVAAKSCCFAPAPIATAFKSPVHSGNFVFFQNLLLQRFFLTSDRKCKSKGTRLMFFWLQELTTLREMRSVVAQRASSVGVCWLLCFCLFAFAVLCRAGDFQALLAREQRATNLAVPVTSGVNVPCAIQTDTEMNSYTVCDDPRFSLAVNDAIEIAACANTICGVRGVDGSILCASAANQSLYVTNPRPLIRASLGVARETYSKLVAVLYSQFISDAIGSVPSVYACAVPSRFAVGCSLFVCFVVVVDFRSFALLLLLLRVVPFHFVVVVMLRCFFLCIFIDCVAYACAATQQSCVAFSFQPTRPTHSSRNSTKQQRAFLMMKLLMLLWALI